MNLTYDTFSGQRINFRTATSLLKSEAGYLFLTHTVSDVGVVVDTDPLTDAGRFMGLGVFGGLGVAVGVEVFTVVVGGIAFKVGGGGGGDNNGGIGGGEHGL